MSPRGLLLCLCAGLLLGCSFVSAGNRVATAQVNDGHIHRQTASYAALRTQRLSRAKSFTEGMGFVDLLGDTASQSCQKVWLDDKVVVNVDSDPSSTTFFQESNLCQEAMVCDETGVRSGKEHRFLFCPHSDADELCVGCAGRKIYSTNKVYKWGAVGSSYRMLPIPIIRKHRNLDAVKAELFLEEKTDPVSSDGDLDGPSEVKETGRACVAGATSKGKVPRFLCPSGSGADESTAELSYTLENFYERDFVVPDGEFGGEVTQCVVVGEGSFGRAWRCSTPDSERPFVVVKDFFLSRRHTVEQARDRAREEMETEVLFGRDVFQNPHMCVPVLTSWEERVPRDLYDDEVFVDDDEAEDEDDEIADERFRVLMDYGGPNIVKLQFANVKSGALSGVEGGALRLRSFGVEMFLNPAVMRSNMLELLQALDYIHSQGVVHSDIKPANVVFDSRMRLIDFGMSVCMSKWGPDGAPTACSQVKGMSDKYMDSFRGGTREYSPPERFNINKETVFYGPHPGAYDIYSAGLIFLEWAAGRSITTSGNVVFWMPLIDKDGTHFDKCSLKMFSVEPLYDRVKYSANGELVRDYYVALTKASVIKNFIRANMWSRYGMDDVPDAAALSHLIRSMINCKTFARPTAGIAMSHAFFTNNSRQFECPDGKKTWYKFKYDLCHSSM